MHVKRFSIFLIMVALIVGMVGCSSGDPIYTLTIMTTAGGAVAVDNNLIIRGTAIITYNVTVGTVVSLNATPDAGYFFVNWTGDVGTIGNVNTAATNITVNGNYTITAIFRALKKIRDWYDLDAIRNNLRDHYILMNDLDATTAGYEELASPTSNEGKGWEPIGNSTSGNFAGTFDGQGYEIRDLFIIRPTESNLGLFGCVNGTIENIGVAVNANLWGGGNPSVVGGLVGANYGTVTNSYSTGSVAGYSDVGGLVGDNYGGTVSNCYFSGSVTGGNPVGGLVGGNFGGIVSYSHSSGSVSGHSFAGGLVGMNSVLSTVSNSYSTGSVTGIEVPLSGFLGGLVGYNCGTVSNSYSTGNVTGDEKVGGLVGCNCQCGIGNGPDFYGTVSDSYSTGSVSGNDLVGGLVGWNIGPVSDSFWDNETSGQATSGGGTGKTTAEMQNITTFSGAPWNITAVTNPSTRNLSYIWNIVDDVTYPFLSWQPVL